MLSNRILSKLKLKKNLNSFGITNNQKLAIVTRFPNDGAVLLETLNSNIKNINVKNLTGFSLEKGQYHPSSPFSVEEGYISLFHFPFKNIADCIFVDEQIRFLLSNWSLGLIERICSILRPNGTIYFPESARKLLCETKFDCSKNKLVLGTRAFFSVKIKNTLSNTKSIFEWYSVRGNSLVLQEVFCINESLQRKKTTFLEYIQVDLNKKSELSKNVLGSGRKPKYENILQNISDVCVAHNYLINGISYKAPLISHIIKDNLSNENEKIGLDLGGGCGALGAELLLENPTIRLVHTHDVAEQNIGLSQDLYTYFNEFLKDRFIFSLGKIETFEFKQSYDFILLIGSLLYVEKTKLDKTISKIWNSISVNGILVVHENIKRKDFMHDYDYMFTAAQLEKLLGKYGEIIHYSSHFPEKITKNKVEEKTVFRVIKKLED